MLDLLTTTPLTGIVFLLFIGAAILGTLVYLVVSGTRKFVLWIRDLWERIGDWRNK